MLLIGQSGIDWLVVDPAFQRGSRIWQQQNKNNHLLDCRIAKQQFIIIVLTPLYKELVEFGNNRIDRYHVVLDCGI